VEHEVTPTDVGTSASGAGNRRETAAQVPDTSGASAMAHTRLHIELEMLSGMTPSAVEHYKQCVTKYAEALAREASRLEEAQRAEEIGGPEITTTMVVKANDVLRRPRVNDPTTKVPVAVAQITSLMAGIVTPIFGANLHSIWQWTVTFACGIIAVAGQVYVALVVRRK
jgi:hypothetical protein